MTAPALLRAGMMGAPPTTLASNLADVLGQPVVAAPSISAPSLTSEAAARAALPSLYKMSRGRSANVSPSRRWDRRCASASVLSSAGSEDSSGDPEIKLEGTTTARPRVRRSPLRHRADQANSNVGALFPEDHDVFADTSSDEDGYDVDCNSNWPPGRRRWSSVERKRRRSLRILLAPDDGLNSAPTDVPHLAGEVDSSPSSSLGSQGGMSISSCSSSSDVIEMGREDSGYFVHADADTDAELSAEAVSAAEISSSTTRPLRRRSRGGAASARFAPRTRCLRAMKPSPSPTPSPSTSPIRNQTLATASPPRAGIEAWNPPSHRRSASIPVDADADPLLGLGMGSVEDLIAVEEVEYWREGGEEAAPSRLVSQPKGAAPQTIHMDAEGRLLSENGTWIDGAAVNARDPLGAGDEQEQEHEHAHRTGLTAAYQERLASLQLQLRLWGRVPGNAAHPGSDATGAAEHAAHSAGSEGLLSSSWRSLARLPNFLIPTLGARSSALPSMRIPQRTVSVQSAEEKDRGTRAGSGIAVVDVNSMAGTDESRTVSPSPPVSLASSRRTSSTSDDGSSGSTSPSSGTIRLPGHGRGVVSPLEGDRDAGAYVSGLGQPIDPDTELSSVVHLQTFRSRSRSGSRSRSDSAQADENAAEQVAIPEKVMPEAEPSASLDGEALLGVTAPSVAASAPPSPTGRNRRLAVDDDSDGGFEPVRRTRRRRSRPRSLRPAVEEPPEMEAVLRNIPGSPTEKSPTPRSYESPARGRASQRPSSRPNSPPASSRQCAVGLYGGAGSRRRSGGTGIRSIKSEPHLSYAAAAATPVDPSAAGGRGPCGARGRGGAVKVVSASVGEAKLAASGGSSPLPLPGPMSGSRTRSASARSGSGAGGVGGESDPSRGPLLRPRPRLLANSAHLLMLSLELEMIKKRKISAPLKPRWGKHRAHDFVPIAPSTVLPPCTRSAPPGLVNPGHALGLRVPLELALAGEEVDAQGQEVEPEREQEQEQEQELATRSRARSSGSALKHELVL